MKGLITEFDFDNCDLYNAENWGKDDNRYVLLDYGVSEYISKFILNK